MSKKKAQPNSIEDVRNVVAQLNSENLTDVLNYAKMRSICETLKLSAEDTPSAGEWDKTPPTVQWLVISLIDRYSLARGAYSNLLKDWEKKK